MINSELFREIVKEKGFKYQFLAEGICVTPYALQKKIDNLNEFKGSEIAKLTKLLGITKTQRDDIFFAN